MAQAKKQGHGAFYLVMAVLALGVLGVGYFLWSQESTDAARERTAEANPSGQQPDQNRDGDDQPAPAASAPEAPPAPGSARTAPGN